MTKNSQRTGLQSGSLILYLSNSNLLGYTFRNLFFRVHCDQFRDDLVLQSAANSCVTYRLFSKQITGLSMSAQINLNQHAALICHTKICFYHNIMLLWDVTFSRRCDIPLADFHLLITICRAACALMRCNFKIQHRKALAF